MRYAVYYSFDPETETALRTLQLTLAKQVVEIPDPTTKMVPHIILMVCDAQDREAILSVFAALEPLCSSFSLSLTNIAAFQGRKPVLYVEPDACPKLQEKYLHCLRLFFPFDIVPSYLTPTSWKPHVTLAKRMGYDAFLQAKKIAEEEWQPREAIIHRLGLINVQRPLEMLASRELL